MSMKPAGKAIIAVIVVVGALGGAHLSGVFDKLKQQGEVAQTSVPSAAPEPEVVQAPAPVAEAPAAPASIPQPINSPVRQSDALDQLIRQSGTK